MVKFSLTAVESTVTSDREVARGLAALALSKLSLINAACKLLPVKATALLSLTTVTFTPGAVALKDNLDFQAQLKLLLCLSSFSSSMERKLFTSLLDPSTAWLSPRMVISTVGVKLDRVLWALELTER
jgi:hypothetical protein